MAGLTGTYWTGNFGKSSSYSSSPLATNTCSASGISAAGSALTLPDSGTYRCFFGFGVWSTVSLSSYEAYLMVGGTKVSMATGTYPMTMACACVDFTAQAGQTVQYYVRCDNGGIQVFEHFYSALWRVG